MRKKLKNYVSNIFINRNVASDEMWKLSEKSLMKAINKTKNDNIIIGYYRVRVFHNSDIEKIIMKNMELIKYSYMIIMTLIWNILMM